MQLNFLSPDGVPLERLEVFRATILSRVLAVLIVGAIVAACAWVGWRGGVAFGKGGALPGFIAWWIAFWLGLYWLFVAADLRKALARAGGRPVAWLAAVGDEAVYVKWRSYLNAHWGAADPQVVAVPFGAIRSAFAHRRTWITPARRHGGDRSETHAFVELRLSTLVDTRALAARLAEERDSRPGGRPKQHSTWRHFPVSLELQNVLRIEWRARPAADEFLEVLRKHGVAIEGEQASRVDLTASHSEAELTELARRGDSIGLIRVLRRGRDISLTDAKQEADRLIRAAASAQPGDTPQGPA
ncbi:MAG: hypothetical protein EXR27_20115 [Betaproteobacteria bacterium]|nr:hypothetical protein [Betaproteobacteria bacterium]